MEMKKPSVASSRVQDIAIHNDYGQGIQANPYFYQRLEEITPPTDIPKRIKQFLDELVAGTPNDKRSDLRLSMRHATIAYDTTQEAKAFLLSPNAAITTSNHLIQKLDNKEAAIQKIDWALSMLTAAKNARDNRDPDTAGSHPVFDTSSMLVIAWLYLTKEVLTKNKE